MQGLESLIEKDLEKTRKQNIAENKAFLAKILADINANGLNIPGTKGRRSSNPKPRRSATPRTVQPDPGARRPVTRQRRSQIIKDGDEEAEDPLTAPPSPDENNNLRVKIKRKRPRPQPISGDEGSPKKRKVDIDEIQLDEISYKCSEKIYDKYNGTTCHQCRQKTIDQKTICKSSSCLSVRGQFCGVCLKNRYGEDARDALLDENWTCPPCRGICNCSICRNREGFCATGILIHVALQRGFPDVNSYLQSLHTESSEDEDSAEEEDEEEEGGEEEEKEKAVKVKKEKVDDEKQDEEEIDKEESNEDAEENGQGKKLGEVRFLKIKLEKLTGMKERRSIKVEKEKEKEKKEEKGREEMEKDKVQEVKVKEEVPDEEEKKKTEKNKRDTMRILKVKLEKLTDEEVKEKSKNTNVEEKLADIEIKKEKIDEDDKENKDEGGEKEVKIKAKRGRPRGRGRGRKRT